MSQTNSLYINSFSDGWFVRMGMQKVVEDKPSDIGQHIYRRFTVLNSNLCILQILYTILFILEQSAKSCEPRWIIYALLILALVFKIEMRHEKILKLYQFHSSKKKKKTMADKRETLKIDSKVYYVKSSCRRARNTHARTRESTSHDGHICMMTWFK